MTEIIDFKCTYDNSVGITTEALKGLELTFPDAYKKWDTMAAIAIAIKKHDQAEFCELPFCHTVEGEALGGCITYGDEHIGPRGKEPICSSAEDILSLSNIDFNRGRISELLSACKHLVDCGEEVVLEVSGPFTILNILMDPRHIFKILRKNPDAMQLVFDKMQFEIISFIQEAFKVGVRLVSYADSSGGVNILGPAVAKQVVDMFTLPLFKKLERVIPENGLLLVCPKTTLALIGSGKADWKDINVDNSTPYIKACVQSIGQVKFVGQMCIKNKEFKIENGVLKALQLI